MAHCRESGGVNTCVSNSSSRRTSAISRISPGGAAVSSGGIGGASRSSAAAATEMKLEALQKIREDLDLRDRDDISLLASTAERYKPGFYEFFHENFACCLKKLGRRRTTI